MKEKSKNWFKNYSEKAEKADNESKIMTLAANMEKDNEITYSLLEEIMQSVNELYDKIPTEKQILSAKIESKDTSSSSTLTSEQLKEIEEREKRTNQIYG
jgi:Mg2+ and Co2+ transporter CorA